MFKALFDQLETPPRQSASAEAMRAPSTESLPSSFVADDFEQPFLAAKSSSSTPPTSLSDNASVSSTSLKLVETECKPIVESSRRSNRSRDSITTYNVKVLAGTSIHAPKKFKKLDDEEIETRRRTVSGDTLVQTSNSSPGSVRKNAQRLVRDGIDALDMGWSVNKLSKSRSQATLEVKGKKSAKQLDLERRRSTRSSDDQLMNITQTIVQKKRKFEETLTRAKREVLRLADTAEFAKIDEVKVITSVWKNGKLYVEEPPAKKRKREAAEAAAAAKAAAEAEELKQKELMSKEIGVKAQDDRPGHRRRKVWLTKGLYAGQEQTNLDWFADRKDLQHVAPYRPNGAFPLPMWHGQRLLHVGRNFKLPFDVCSPLPPGQPKPDEWKKTSTNRFIGEAGALWKKSKLFDDSSKCVCIPDGGCDVDCQNRIMLYECDDNNCGAGRDHCTNRAFADLQDRRKIGGKYRIGVEVIKTADRGYGVRSNRCFEPHQIIVEYTGEIITEDECDRRMNEEYKENDCYYLMSFDQNMIIDATKGSIARFVNHSCKPNSRMVKWIVGGKPRMALFAGDNPIMTGDELTYDYNFDPFSAKNVQECRCGSDNCRGVLGPKPKEIKPIKETIKETVKGAGKALKRKVSQMLGGEVDSDAQSPKKRKIKEAKGVKGLKRSASTASLALSKGAKAVKRTVINARQSVTSKKSTPAAKRLMKVTTLKKYTSKRQSMPSRKVSLNSSAENSPRRRKSMGSVKKSVGSIRKNVVRKSSGGKFGSKLQAASQSTIRVIPNADD